MLGFSYHPYIGVPTSFQKYCDLVRAFLQHCIRRYGADSLQHWLFDFWNTANLQTANGFWVGTQEEFFHFYRDVWRIFQEVDPRLRLGTPNFSLPDGISWYEDFLQMCRHEHITPHFFPSICIPVLTTLSILRGFFPIRL